MGENATLRVEDLVPVRSRVSWGAIVAGAVLAMAVYLVLTLLGGAIGLTVSDNVRTDSLKTGGAIWAILATAIALFVGGWVTTQCTMGENKTEAVVHGVIMWGVVLAMLLWLMATGIRAGFNAMVGMANVGSAAARNTTTEDWEAAARRSGGPQPTSRRRLRRRPRRPGGRSSAPCCRWQLPWLEPWSVPVRRFASGRSGFIQPVRCMRTAEFMPEPNRTESAEIQTQAAGVGGASGSAES